MKSQHAITTLCQVLEVSASGYARPWKTQARTSQERAGQA
jgi:hypothetical protein